MKTTLFAFYAAQYLDERQFEVAPSTLISEKSKIGNLVKYFGKREMTAITQIDIKAWKVKVHKRFANKTINEHFTILRALFKLSLDHIFTALHQQPACLLPSNSH